MFTTTQVVNTVVMNTTFQVVFITAKIAFIFTSFSAVHIYDFRIFHSHLFTTSRVILNQLDDQLPVGSLARLVKCCTGIAEVMGSNPPTGLNFFRPYSHYCSSSFVEKVLVIHRGESP